MLLFLLQWASVVVAVEATTELLVESKLFAPLRNWVGKRAITVEPETEPTLRLMAWAKLFELVTCGYCVSVWVALFYASTLPALWTSPLDETVARGTHLINFLVRWLVLHRLSNWLHVVTELVRKGRVLAIDVETSHKQNPENTLSIPTGEDHGPGPSPGQTGEAAGT